MFERFETPVRCADGHLYTSIWVPLASLKAVRLGGTRLQRCPVGHHWAKATPVDAQDLSPADREAAAAVHDIRIP